ncbi:58-like isoform X2 [Octopus vulgaris]|uniref:58-like isoform X2 n=1 Tax=Octopus vulgaris TaxID=6645 RepID=A0AA36F3V9_OCTVU|nr:58-like isoform X2 [Octopus vulgaris]
MKLLWIITCVLSVSFGVTDVAKAQQADKPAAALKRKSCSKWVFDECKVNGGVCGSGKKIGRRTGSNCGKKEKTFSCTIPCESNDMVNNKMNKDKKKRAGGKECKYMKGTWSACDPNTSTKNMTMMLKKGDPKKCPETRIKSKGCKQGKDCKYNKGAWSKCDPTTKTKSRTLTLKAPSDSSCPASKPQTKDCKGNVNNKGCKYSYGDWSACNTTSNIRTKTMTLDSGDRSMCEATKTVTKSCNKKGGKERCFFGAWGEFGPCRNGVKIKKRVVQYGDSECMKRAVKTLSC